MKNILYNSNKGAVLLIAVLALGLVLGTGASFFIRSVSQKRIVDMEKFVMQADFLAESGANHGLAELQRRVNEVLKGRISQIRNSNLIRPFCDQNNPNPLGFLVNYAVTGGGAAFTIQGNAAVLTSAMAALPLNTGINGDYSVRIEVTSNGVPVENPVDVYRFFYNYRIIGEGSVLAVNPQIDKRVTLYGDFSIVVRRDNFARFALFTNQHRSPNGVVVWFTQNTNFFGPVHTNERFSFANNPSGSFTDEVTQHSPTARFYHAPGSGLLNANSYLNFDVPTFGAGFLRGEEELNLVSAVTVADLRRQALGGMGQPGSNGIYVPNDGSRVTGGIFIRGNADSVEMSVVGNNPRFSIRQGTTRRNILVDYSAGTTSVETVGGATEVYSGVPNGVDGEGIIIHTQGAVRALNGTVQSDTSMTVSSEGDIVINNNILYENFDSEPQLNADGFGNILGILALREDIDTSSNIRIGTGAPNNVQIHGIIMAPHGVFTVDDYDRNLPRGTATLLGGVITDKYGPFGTFSGQTQRSGYGRNFIYDPRVLRGQTPPYFPFMDNFDSDDGGDLYKRPRWQRS